MRLLNLLPAALVLAPTLLFANLTARADTVFDVTSTGGASTTGTLDINTTTGTVVSSDIEFDGASLINIGGQGDYNGVNGYALIFSNTALNAVQFTFSGDYSLQNYMGGGFSIFNDYATSSGNVGLPTAATPEPSTLALIGTGILGLAGMARRKFLPQS